MKSCELIPSRKRLRILLRYQHLLQLAVKSACVFARCQQMFRAKGRERHAGQQQTANEYCPVPEPEIPHQNDSERYQRQSRTYKRQFRPASRQQ